MIVAAENTELERIGVEAERVERIDIIAAVRPTLCDVATGIESGPVEIGG